MSNATAEAVLDTIQTKLAGVGADQVKLEMFNTIDELAREALRITPPTNTNADPETWLTTAQWTANYQPVLDGTLARLYAQLGKPWSSPDLSKVHQDRYGTLLQLARSDAAGSPATVYERLINNLRVQIPIARDSALQLEVYNTADKIRREAFWLAPLTDSNTDPSSWLSSDQWDNCYQALLHGALARLYSQTAKPWANDQQAQEHYKLYLQELDLVRGEQSTATPSTNFERLMDIARVRLPGARDNVINIELYMLVNDFLQRSNIWVDELTVSVTAGVTDYPISSISGAINRLMALVDADNRPIPCSLIVPTLYVPDYAIRLRDTPTSSATYTAAVSLMLDANSQPSDALPDWIVAKYRDGLEDGLLARMMMQQAKPYTNIKLAEYHGHKYMAAVAVARNEALHAYKFRGQGWAYPRNFFTSGKYRRM